MSKAKSAYAQKLLDPRWQKMRLQVLERDNWACRLCGNHEKTLHAHHTYYVWGVDPWEYPPETIVTVCNECHDGEHANWDCGEIRDSLCANGLWSVYDRMFLAGAINGGADARPLTDLEAKALISVVEAFCWSLRNESGGQSIAKEMFRASQGAPSCLPWGRERPADKQEG